MAEPPHFRRRSSCVIVPCSEFETLVCVNDVGYEVSAIALESVRKDWTNLRISQNADCAASASSDPSDIPIVGCELTPYVLLRLPDKSVATDDVPESAPINGLFLRYKWYRIQSDKKIAICSVHPSEQATLQGLGCVNAKIPVAKSYHCSPKCFANSWQHHRVLHEHAANAVNKNGTEGKGSKPANAASVVLHVVSDEGIARVAVVGVETHSAVQTMELEAFWILLYC
nr:carbon catabolite repressor protein 4 homolog 1-like [Ipomoea trifida]